MSTENWETSGPNGIAIKDGDSFVPADEILAKLRTLEAGNTALIEKDVKHIVALEERRTQLQNEADELGKFLDGNECPPHPADEEMGLSTKPGARAIRLLRYLIEQSQLYYYADGTTSKHPPHVVIEMRQAAAQQLVSALQHVGDTAGSILAVEDRWFCEGCGALQLRAGQCCEEPNVRHVTQAWLIDLLEENARLRAETGKLDQQLAELERDHRALTQVVADRGVRPEGDIS